MRHFPLSTPALLLGAALALVHTANHAAPTLIGVGSLSGSAQDKSGLNYALENGLSASLLGGLGSGLAWAGGNTFLALPDRGPNATAWNPAVDDTTSYISRFQTVKLDLVASPGGPLPYTLNASLQGTTLLSSASPLNYGSVQPSTSGLIAGNTPSADGKSYFSGRSDNFAAGASSNPNNARLDPEGIRVSNDGKSVFISDEYGPYVYQFDRATGQRIRTFTLPDSFAVKTLSSQGAAEIAGNKSGRVANKGMEGLAISPDGKTLYGFMQSPLIQDGGDGGRYNRIVRIDIATGAVTQFAFDNQINGKAYNSSELLALNDHQLLVLERDGKGLGDGSKAVVKQITKIELNGAQEVSGIADLRTQPGAAIVGSKFLDIKAALNAAGISDANIPAKIEGMAFGEDVMINGHLQHTLYLANDNDFLGSATPNGSNTAVPYNNLFYVFAYDGNDLVNQDVTPMPEPATLGLVAAGALGLLRRRSASRR